MLKSQHQLTTINIMLARRIHPRKPLHHAQRGAAMMVMLVIMVMGTAAFLVSALSNTSLKNTRDKNNEAVLAQAKDALISFAVTDKNNTSPGSLPCPDNLGAGEAEVAANCTAYIGRLPWKTLGLPDLRDSSGAPLWYALSKNFRKDVVSNPINSDSTGTLKIFGSPAAGNLVAIIFAPGASLGGQSRSDIQTAACTTTGNTVIQQSLCATNYLEGQNAFTSPAAAPNTQYVVATNLAGAFVIGTAYKIETLGTTDFTSIGAASNTVGLAFTATGVGVGTGTASSDTTSNNDQATYITTDNLIPNVEKRIAREVKQCLDDYAAESSSKYPWAAKISPLDYVTSSDNKFGRVPDQPTIGGYPNVKALKDALDDLQTKETNCQSNANSTKQSALTSAGNALLVAGNDVNQPPFLLSVGLIHVVADAGNAASANVGSQTACQYIEDHNSNNPVQNSLNNAYSEFATETIEDGSMRADWQVSCFLSTPASAYWSNWKQLVFYRVSNKYRPNGSKNCGTPPSCLSVRGNGNPNQGSDSYRAVVIVAGKNLTNTARIPTNIAGYLEGLNTTVGTTEFETWQLAEQKTKSINDFVVCADGKGKDSNSKCY